MASVTSYQEDCAIPEMPTVVGSPGNCDNNLDLKEEISEDKTMAQRGISAPPSC